MIPANKRFHTLYRFRFVIIARLKIQTKLALLKRLMQLILYLFFQHNLIMHQRLEKLIVLTTTIFSLIHRQISVQYQLLRTPRIIRINRYTNTRTRPNHMIRHLDRPTQRFDNPKHCTYYNLLLIQISHDNSKLIAT